MNMPNTLIETEHEKSYKYMLDQFLSSNGQMLVKLSVENVAKVEAMIHTDSNYIKASQVNNPEASPFWILEMQKYLTEADYEGIKPFDETVMNVVKYLDSENTTHLNADRSGRDFMAREIIENRNRLLYLLLHPNETNLELIKVLSRRTNATKKARRNLSFASKFCHFSCYYMFKGQPEQDNYSIYDSVVKNALPDYCIHYNLGKRSLKALSNYAVYRQTIDQILESAEERISRNGFDHLLWYFFKGHQLRKKRESPTTNDYSSNKEVK